MKNEFDYPINSAGRKMTQKFLVSLKNEIVGEVLKRIERDIKDYDMTHYIYIIDNDSRLLGVVSIRDLLSSSKNRKIGDIMKRNLISVSPDSDREKAADLAVKHNIKAIPVVERRKLVGVISTDEILKTLNKALREDVLHLAGIHRSHLKYENTLEVPLFFGLVHRLPWLILGLIGITFAAIFIGFFEKMLDNYLIIAFFIPAIVYMSNALGTQHQTLFIRDLAVLGKDLNIKKYILKQMTIGVLLALIISILLYLIILIFWKQPFMSLVISCSMFITISFSSFTALMITLIINKLKLDPALGSGPFGTIISDVSSIIIYLLVAVLFIGI